MDGPGEVVDVVRGWLGEESVAALGWDVFEDEVVGDGGVGGWVEGCCGG